MELFVNLIFFFFNLTNALTGMSNSGGRKKSELEQIFIRYSYETIQARHKNQPICKYDVSLGQRQAVTNHEETIKSLRTIRIFFFKPLFGD